MSKRTTKADVILAAAKQRMDEALEARNRHRAAEERAQAIYEAHADIYDELKRALAPKPRGKSSPAPSAAPRSSRKKDKEKTDLTLAAATEEQRASVLTASSAASTA